jgi:hypothetical protein
MQLSSHITERIFSVKNEQEFNELALEIFRYQYHNNKVYREFIGYLDIPVRDIVRYVDIPCLPIEFFKHHKVVSGEKETELHFKSSGTTGIQPSTHYLQDAGLYHKSFLNGFRYFYGKPDDYVILGLLPSYLERQHSSLVYMVSHLIESSQNLLSGFFPDDYHRLDNILEKACRCGKKIMLLGVSYALLDFCESFPQRLHGHIVMETGGMKGRRNEMTREELHRILTEGFGVENIHSEYGMTELLSQGYSKGNGIFKAPPWMKVMARDCEDPFQNITQGRTGGINIIDLANVYSCSFLATQDLGKVNDDGGFEVLGRFDASDVRGCNLMIS